MTCALFDSLIEARESCERAADAGSRVRFDIFDHEGRVNPPLLTIVPLPHRASLDSSPAASRRRSLVAWTFLTVGVVLCVYAWPQRGSARTVWSSLIGINLILYGGRFFWMNFADRELERARQRRFADAANAARAVDPIHSSRRPAP